MTDTPVVAPLAESAVAEYQAVRSAVGLFEDAALGVVQITGNDRVAFLHNLISSEIKKLPVGRGNFGYLLNTTGHVVAELTVLHLADRLLVLAPATMVARVAADLEKFHISEKVLIEDVSAKNAVTAIHGPAAGDLLNDAFSLDVLNPEEFQHFEMTFEGATVRAVARRYAGGPGFDFVVPADRIVAFRETLRMRGADHGLRTVGPEVQEILRLEAGVPKHPNELNESVLGPELGRPKGFASGKCYPGQEVVARIDARGHVNKRLMGLRIAGGVIPAVGDEVKLGERKVAAITSAAWSPELCGPIALGFVRREAAPGAEVHVLHAGAVLTATVQALPFRNV